MWASSRWLVIGNDALEMRSTVPGLLDLVSGLREGDPEDDLVRHEAAFSLVIDRSDKKKRRLPSFYVGPYQISAFRDIPAVLERVQRTIDVAVAASHRPVYAFHPCRLGDRYGLYARDFFNRAPYRRKLMRAGLEFAADPYAVLQGSRFWCDDWGSFRPSFVVLANDAADPTKVVETRGALLSFSAATMRVGKLDPAELRVLMGALEGLRGLAAGSAQSLAEVLIKTPS